MYQQLIILGVGSQWIIREKKVTKRRTINVCEMVYSKYDQVNTLYYSKTIQSTTYLEAILMRIDPVTSTLML